MSSLLELCAEIEKERQREKTEIRSAENQRKKKFFETRKKVVKLFAEFFENKNRKE